MLTYLLFGYSDKMIFDNHWTYFDFNASQKPQAIQTEEVDFQLALNSTLAKIFEQNNGIDNTKGDLNFERENFQIMSLTSLYEGENNSLLFQKELFISKENYNYYGGLINRYATNNFLLGVNSFIDKQKEEGVASIGSEFVYANFFKSYANYYIHKEMKNSLQFGLNFALPDNQSIIFDIYQDDAKNNYQFSYKPYKAFSFNLLHKTFDHKDEMIFRIGFSFDFNENFFKQLKTTDDILEGIERYNFFEKNR